VSLRLKRPDATFLPKLALPPLRPVCRSAGDRYSDTWHPCGTGPFKLPKDGWVRGSSVTVVRHDGYFERGMPYLDGVTWLYNMTQFTQRFKLEAGELDIYRDATQAEFSRFNADPRWAHLGEAEAETSVAAEVTTTPP
jgi:ABC-type transport system substrate-binding protein